MISRRSSAIPHFLLCQRLQVQIVLEKNLQTERFDNRFTTVDNSQKGYHEQAERKTNILTIKRFDPVGQTDKFTTEKLELNSDIYLPWALEHFLGRLLEKKIGVEYVFMVYNNCSLCYHCLRVADCAGPTAEDSQANAIYLIGQRGVQGPVVETWLDENGRMLNRRSGDMVVERSSEEKIKQLWPEEFKQK